MTEHLQFIPLRSPGDRDWTRAEELYRNSFPPNEQRSPEDCLRALADPHFTAEGIRLDGQFAGILYHWHAKEWDYIEHLAIAPELRGRKIGSEVLEAFSQGRRVILEIDPPVDDISIRRLHFYRRAGFSDNPQEYMHPSYRRAFGPHRLVLMSRPGPLTNEEARMFADFVRETVLRCSEHENLTLPRLP